MHIIDRSAVSVPTCLDSPPARFRDLRGEDKEEIRRALFTIQGERCAYCERRTGDGRKDGHIEHFRNQANHKNLECAWTNMFWSCNDESTCGKYKDKCSHTSGPQKLFDPDHIINPSEEDPEKYFLFVYDGTIHLVENLSETEQLRAEESLRIFQLRSALLKKSREDAVSPVKRIVEMLLENSPQVLSSYIESELSNLATTPFSTSIKTYLQSVSI
jgi:uncharacterized protein (TIGR02646 family)